MSLNQSNIELNEEKDINSPLAKVAEHDRIVTVKNATGVRRVIEHDSESSDMSSTESSDFEDNFQSFKGINDFKKAKNARHKPLYKNNDGGEKTLYCHYCKEYFNRTPDHPKNFINHIRLTHAVSNDNGTFTCQHCSTISKDKIALRRHFNTHRILDNPRVCPQCGKTFDNFNEWRSHCKKHQKIKRSFGCYLCGNIVYTSKSSLVSHLMTFHKQLGRKCKYCNKCILFEEWDEHEKMEKDLHKEPIVVICEICAQTFTSKESAANHRRNYHQNKPEVSCNECGKKFRTTTNLAQHRTNTHAEKRFECRCCGYRSSYKYLVHIHIKKQHPSIVFEGMPEDAVIEHEPGTVGRQDNRRRRLLQNNKGKKKVESISQNKVHQNNYSGNVTFVQQNSHNDQIWSCLAFNNNAWTNEARN